MRFDGDLETEYELHNDAMVLMVIAGVLRTRNIRKGGGR